MRPIVPRILAVAAMIVLFAAYIYSVNDVFLFLILGLALLVVMFAEHAQYQRLRSYLDADRRVKWLYIALMLAPFAIAVICVASFHVLLTEMGATFPTELVWIGWATSFAVIALLGFFRYRLIKKMEGPVR
jgi:phosphatidylglycerophosphate synthase